MSEERVKPRSLFVDEAIALALESRWADALAVNQSLVERHGADEDTLNRIGKALTELGRREEGLASYSASLQINPLNLIAQKNVRKLTAMLESKSTAAGSAAAIDVELFTEEPGKSAITVLSAPSKSATVDIAPGMLSSSTGRGRRSGRRPREGSRSARSTPRSLGAWSP